MEIQLTCSPFPFSPYGGGHHANAVTICGSPHQIHSQHHHPHLANVSYSEHLQHQLSTSPTNESTITVLESGPPGLEQKTKLVSHMSNDHNNNGNIYQNLAPKKESHSPPGCSKLSQVREGNHDLNPSDESSGERPSCWTKI